MSDYSRLPRQWWFWLLGVGLGAYLLARIRKVPVPPWLLGIVDNPLRHRLMPPDAMAERHGLKEGMRVLEIGPGGGTYTLAAARRVGPTGRLIALDIQSTIARRVQEMGASQGVTNLDVHLGDVHHLCYPDETFDAAILMAAMGEIPEPVAALESICRVLRPGGILSCTEMWIDPDFPRQSTLTAWATAAGFRKTNVFDHWLYYTMSFQKPSSSL